jgi:hypothetical protein
MEGVVGTIISWEASSPSPPPPLLKSMAATVRNAAEGEPLLPPPPPPGAVPTDNLASNTWVVFVHNNGGSGSAASEPPSGPLPDPGPRSPAPVDGADDADSCCANIAIAAPLPAACSPPLPPRPIGTAVLLLLYMDAAGLFGLQAAAAAVAMLTEA